MQRFSAYLTLMICTLLLANHATSQGNGLDNVQISATKLSDTVYMLTGAGGNVGLSAGEDGVFIIDDQYAPLSEKIQAAIAEISDQPIDFVINTHWHHDHTGGNENFGTGGSIIIAHNNVRERLSSDQFIEFFQFEAKAPPKVALPVITFNDELSLHLNGESVTAFHQSHAHSDSDSIIHFSGSNVIHMGDTFFKGTYPFIDTSNGGNINGVIKANAFALSLANDDTQIIPGHGQLAGKADQQAYYEMLIAVRDAVKIHVDTGRTLEETIAAKPTADFDEQWGQGFIKAESIVRFAYESLKQ